MFKAIIFSKVHLLIWLFFAPFIDIFSQNTFINGEIKKPVDSTVSFIILRNGLVGERELIDIRIDKSNRFNLKLNLDDIAYIHFQHGNTSGIVFRNWIVEPKDSVTLSFNAENFIETLRFNGVNSMKYNYYTEDLKKWNSWTGEYMKRIKQPIEDQYHFIDSVENGKLKLLQLYSKHLSHLFFKVRYADIKGDVNESRFLPLISENKNSYSLWSLPNNLKAFLYMMPDQNDTTAKSLFYVAYLDALSTLLYKDVKTLFGNKSMSNLIDFQRSIYTPKVAEYQFAYQLFDKFRTEGSNEENNKLYENYANTYPASSFIPFLNGRQIKSTSVRQGQKAFDLGDDSISKLVKYHGKVVVLDFWASWCSSCITDVKYIKKIKEDLNMDNNVVFLSISLDEKEEDWIKAINKWDIMGTHIRLKGGFKSSVSKEYGIMGLPSYFIIDKNGLFFDVNPPRPRYNDGQDLLKVIQKAID